MFVLWFHSFESARTQADEYRTRRGWLGRWSLPLKYAKYCYWFMWWRFRGDPDRWFAAQQYAVCLRMQRRPEKALYWLKERAYQAALSITNETARRGALAGIYRDMGMCTSDMGALTAAKSFFVASLQYVEAGSVAHAATSVQIARLEMRQGKFNPADAVFRSALVSLEFLEGVDARKQELYALLHATENDIARGMPSEAYYKLIRIFELIPEHGSKSHKLKAISLLVFAEHPRVVQRLWHTVTMPPQR